MEYDQWFSEMRLPEYMRPHAYLRELYRRGMTPDAAVQHCCDSGMAEDPNVPIRPTKSAMGRPRVRFDWTRAQMHFARAIIKAADGIAGRQFRHEADRQRVFAVREKFEAILRKLHESNQGKV